MNSKSEAAEKLFVEGFSCAQSVLAPFCEKYGLDTETALKLASPLGGGCGLAELCGAVSGGAMVVGLKYGQYIAGDKDSGMNCREKRDRFIEEFRKCHDSVTCRGLLGFDLTTAEGEEKYIMMIKDRGSSTCFKFVGDAARILEGLGY